MIKSRLRALGEKIRPNKEPDQQEQVKEFLGDLKELTGSVEVLLDDVSDQFEGQIMSKRPLIQKTLGKLPQFLQTKEVKEQNTQSNEFRSVKSRIHEINLSIDKVEEMFETIPSQEEVAKRVYELTYPGEEVTIKRIDEIESRFKEMEERFIESVKTVTDQMQNITSSLTRLTELTEEQGVVVNNIDIKLDRVETKMDKAIATLDKISRKISQNKLLLAFIAGVLVIALAALIF
jgi:methyl-accepting chemotaxis protein